MIRFPGMGVFLAVGVALLMHLLLFAAVQPYAESSLNEHPIPPRTRYLPNGAGQAGGDDSEVRIVKSPVVFSMPSEMGFSSVLMDNDVKTKLAFQQPVKTEHFLDLASATYAAEKQLAPLRMMVSSEKIGPSLPSEISSAKPMPPATQRVVLAPELQARLMGVIALPPELNQSVETPWEIHAEISVSEQGAVKYVLLDQPLESTALNQSVQRMLYGLRFKAGAPMESTIDIYSPDDKGGMVQ